MCHGFNTETRLRTIFATIRALPQRGYACCSKSNTKWIDSRQKSKAQKAYKDVQDLGSLRPIRPKHVE